MLIRSALMSLACSKYPITGSSYYYRFKTALCFVLTKGLYMKLQICINLTQVSKFFVWIRASEFIGELGSLGLLVIY